MADVEVGYGSLEVVDTLLVVVPKMAELVETTDVELMTVFGLAADVVLMATLNVDVVFMAALNVDAVLMAALNVGILDSDVVTVDVFKGTVTTACK